MADDETGIGKPDDPRSEDRAQGGAPRQTQQWPGDADQMRPEPDHGEESYVGAGKLAGKRAIITGGDSGIGRAVAIAFAREGCDVAIAYYDEHDDADETAEWVRRADRRAVCIDGDLSDHDHCRAVVDRAASELGGLDLLVNNAGLHFEKTDFTDISPDQLERTFRTNVFAYVWMAQHALEHLETGSSIINTGSVTGLRGSDTLIDYAATKGAIHSFTKSLAHRLAERSIRVNCVAPGPVWTPLIASGRVADEVEGFGGKSLWDRPAQPAELAPFYVFLAAADSRFMTGEIVAPTGLPTTTG